MLFRSATATKLAKEEVESLDEEFEQIIEGKMDHMSLTHLWHAHAKHSYGADQGWGGGVGGQHSKHAATAIENHVRKHHGNKVADDMVNHSDLHVAHAEYVGGKEAKEVEHDAEKLRKKHGIKGNLYGHHDNSIHESIGGISTISDEALDPEERTTDTLRGRVKGGEHNKHQSFKVKLKAEEAHPDEAEDKALVKKMVKPSALKKEGKRPRSEEHTSELQSH